MFKQQDRLNDVSLTYGNLACEKLESTIYVDIRYSFRNIHYKTVSLLLGIQKVERER